MIRHAKETAEENVAAALSPPPLHPSPRLTGVSNAQDLTQDQGQLDAAPGERALMFIFPAAVLQYKLGRGGGGTGSQ